MFFPPLSVVNITKKVQKQFIGKRFQQGICRYCFSSLKISILHLRKGCNDFRICNDPKNNDYNLIKLCIAMKRKTHYIKC